jgi:hypothetical protein
MAAVGGSIESIILAGRNFAVTTDAESQRKLGGFEIEVQANGDGSARIIKTRVPLMLEGITVEIDDDRGDQEYLRDLTNLNDFFPIVISYASGSDYQGTAQIVGETTASSQNASASISLSGPGILTKQ